MSKHPLKFQFLQEPIPFKTSRKTIYCNKEIWNKDGLIICTNKTKKSNLKFALQNDLQVLGLEPTELFLFHETANQTQSV